MTTAAGVASQRPAGCGWPPAMTLSRRCGDAPGRPDRPGVAHRPYLPLLVGDPIALGGMLGRAAVGAGGGGVAPTAWTWFDVAMLACPLARIVGSPGVWWRHSAGPLRWCRSARAIAQAALTRPMWLNAWGKLPSSSPVAGSTSSASRPTSLA
jgi:hypothetical protein